MQRQQTISHLQNNPQIDVLIIGGGINGIGTFRELALNGARVLLVERRDFCSGASAASSHMVHGGIRYLENGEFRLVREAVHERNRLLKNAPHLVKPQPTLVPMFHWWTGLLNAPLKFLRLRDKPGERGGITIKLGLMMYDAFTGRNRSVPRHRFLQRKRSLRHFPKLNPAIRATATYYDASMVSPERLALEVLLDGLKYSKDAYALNYVTAGSQDGSEVILHDSVSDQTIRVQPKVVVNAAGPWIDFVNEDLGRDTHFVGGTKGSHIVLDHPELLAATHGHEIFFENDDGRIVLIYPVFGRVMVGTTDIKIDNPDDAICTEEEIDYFFEFVKHIFPTIEVDRSHIVYRFSGVRPLPYSDAGYTGQISRDHEIAFYDTGAFPVLNLIGGKWTTFRAFSEQVADKVLGRVGKKRLCSTHERPIGGGRHYPQDADQWCKRVSIETGLAIAYVEQLFERYGTEAEEAAQFIRSQPRQGTGDVGGYTKGEIKWLLGREMVIHLVDFIQRRTLLAMQGKLTRKIVVELAEIIGAFLNWDDSQIWFEIGHTLQLLEKEHQITL